MRLCWPEKFSKKQVALPQLDVSERSLQSYDFYSATGYKTLKTLLYIEERDVHTADCLKAIVESLESIKLPFYK